MRNIYNETIAKLRAENTPIPFTKEDYNTLRKIGKELEKQRKHL